MVRKIFMIGILAAFLTVSLFTFGCGKSDEEKAREQDKAFFEPRKERLDPRNMKTEEPGF